MIVSQRKRIIIFFLGIGFLCFAFNNGLDLVFAQTNDDKKNQTNQKPQWKLDRGILANLYDLAQQKNSPVIGKQVSLSLRLAQFDIHRKQLLFYDDKGNPLVVHAQVLIYDKKVLTHYRKLIPGVQYRIRVAISGLDIRKRLAGQLIDMQRIILSSF